MLRKRQFGASSERLQERLIDQLSLMANEAEAYAYGTKNATAEQVAVKAHARKQQIGNVPYIVPEGTPTEEVEHRLSEEERTCDTCGAVMEEIGKEVRRSLKMEPARLWIRDVLDLPLLWRLIYKENEDGTSFPEQIFWHRLDFWPDAE